MEKYLIPSPPILGLIIAVALDFVAQSKNVAREDNVSWRYIPNLPVWGIGLLAGISYTLVYLYASLVLGFIKQFPCNKSDTWQYFIPLILSSLMLGFLLLAITKLCRND